MLAAQQKDSAALDRLAVEISYSLARCIEHSEQYNVALLQLLKKLPRFADSVALVGL
jgi:hypothetical protein